MAFKDLPADARPREKLIARGAAALGDAELLALLLRTGVAGKNVLRVPSSRPIRRASIAGDNSPVPSDSVAGLSAKVLMMSPAGPASR